MKNIQNLPKIYYINLEDAVERNQHMLDQFKKHNITNFERYEAKRPAASGHNKLNIGQYGCITSHIEVLRKIASLGDEYAIVFEDDVDIKAINYWNFTWDQFFNMLPDFDIIQLFRSKVNDDFTDCGELNITFRKWEKTDFVSSSYIITKSYAKKIVDMFDNKTLYGFGDFSKKIGPVADFMLFNEGNSYSTSIFTVKIFPSSIDDKIWEPYIKNIRGLNNILKNKITLDDIFTTYESDSVISQA